MATDGADRSALDWAREIGEADRVIEDLDRYLHRRRRRRKAVLASAGAGLMLAVIALPWLPRSAVHEVVPGSETVHKAANAVVVHPTTRTLPDGSVLQLKAGAEAAVEFTPECRGVTLRKGEAHFQVAKDAQRPFVVTAQGVAVRAVGTAFSVQLGTKEVEVLVTDGRVAVENGAKDPTPPVASGHRIVVDLPSSPEAGRALPVVAAISPDELNERLSWRVPRLEFAGTPLSQALPMFNEHSPVKLVMADASIGNLQLSGVLRANNIESLLRLLEGEFGLTAEKRGDKIVIGRR